jgi:hypothetical protein
MLWRLQIFIGHKMEWQFARLGQLKQLVRKQGVKGLTLHEESQDTAVGCGHASDRLIRLRQDAIGSNHRGHPGRAFRISGRQDESALRRFGRIRMATGLLP